MTDLSLLEKEMQLALFGPEVAEKPKKQPRLSAYSAGLIVVASVRRDVGLPFRLEFPVRTISHIEAWTEAHKHARLMGLRIWAVLDIRKSEKSA